MIPDWINGCFEIAAAGFIMNHVRVLRKFRQPFGVSVLSVTFFALWGFWNIFYYPHLGQWFSFVGGLVVVITNVVYIATLILLRKQHRITT